MNREVLESARARGRRARVGAGQIETGIVTESTADGHGQFQVVTSGGQAELGRALGGYINVITRSGTNVMGGGAYAFLRDDRLTAANQVSGETLPMRQWQCGASTGGPIVKNQTFYFANVEQRRLDQTGLVSIAAGTHALRAGADVSYNDSLIHFPRAMRGSYTFSSIAAFVNGAYNNSGFMQTFGAGSVAQGNANVGVYVQDEWHAGARLTLNLGLRYDLQFLETIDTDRNNLVPRAGFAWMPFGDLRTGEPRSFQLGTRVRF